MKCILNKLSEQEFFKKILTGDNVSVEGLAPGIMPHLLYAISEKTERSVLYVCSNDLSAKTASKEYLYSNGVYLPSPSPEMSHVEARANEISAARVYAISKMTSGRCVSFLSPDALMGKLCAKDQFFSLHFELQIGQIIQPKTLAEKFAKGGYRRVSLIEGRGQFSGRGEILEVYTESSPYRITFFDDEIESIKRFDPETQRSYGEEIHRINIHPAEEVTPNEAAKVALSQYLKSAEHLSFVSDRYNFELEEWGRFPNIEAFVGVMGYCDIITDYLQDPIVIFADMAHVLAEDERRLADRLKLFASVLDTGGAFGCENSWRFDIDEFIKTNTTTIDFAGLRAHFKNKISANVKQAVGFSGDMHALSDAIKSRTKFGSVYLFAGGRAASLSNELLEHAIEAPLTDGNTDEKTGGVWSVSAKLSSGFELGNALFLSEVDIFAHRSSSHKKTAKKAKNLEDFLADIHVGDVVVHEIQGKGRFIGVKTMDVAGVKADYLELEYKGGDTLFVQTSQIDRVQKYIGPGDENAQLSKLGGKEWENAKARARASVKQLTENLQELYSERANLQGFSYSEDTVWQRQFEENFEHDETPGQRESSEQIKRDMESGRVMDRLLLGDVGYGKTEVAMRTCFKAVMDSKQVAMLVPTTLLARQHYSTFKERFAGFPIKIEMLSRFTKKPKEVLKKIADGSVDIVIGTHKLLSKDVIFKDLGLLVVDEEQRFGVSHKERIKNMRRQVDVLTLTATPIPRTLEMAMTGIRDMSTIDTPPEERKEVVAYVAQFSWSLVAQAIRKELARGGQIFLVCRRIAQTEELLLQLKKHVPEARSAIAHGQMTEQAFESVVSSFYDKEYDVLVCTTIIESGIDIKNANTIIVYEADKFGLAQLYQLKGRVGRSNLRAYAYFTHIDEDVHGEASGKRLAAIREFTQFGSGFRIAMRDLEIRGAGNVLGAEQSGHMAQVGYNLYCKFMKKEVDEAFGRVVQEERDTAVELGSSAYIPEKYIPDTSIKLDMYRRIAGVRDYEDAKELRKEIEERFGKIPKETENLVKVSVIRAYAKHAYIASVIKKAKTIELKFFPDAPMDLPKVLRLLANFDDFTLRPSEVPVIVVKIKKGVFTQILQLLELLKRCTIDVNSV